jgi:S-adenosylmethionine:tRNA ribosyltransferase-isomerase
MRRSDFYYELPEELIATEPCSIRSASRMLCLDPATGSLNDSRFSEFPSLLAPGDLLVFNNTRVIPARLFGRKHTGGRVEVLIERLSAANRALAQVRASKPLRPGTGFILDCGEPVQVCAREGDLYLLEFPTANGLSGLLERVGHVPLPPYIRRAERPDDRARYQTVYARIPGAVAAPTAGLHFDAGVLQELESRGIDTACLTLHIGAGTFQPVRVEDLDEHVMHAEYFEVDGAVCRKVRATRERGGRVVAVGTTVVRSLEAATGPDGIRPCRGETSLFITPGYRFRSVDALLTNFHLPESTLLMLVCALAGRQAVMAAYRHAIRGRYRFYSYGDAMFINRCQPSARG